MIKIDLKAGTLEVKGRAPVICGEVETIIRNVKKSLVESLGEKVADEMLNKIWARGNLSEDDIVKENLKPRDEIDELNDWIKEILK